MRSQRNRILALALAVGVTVSAPAMAEDLTYQHPRGGTVLIEGFDGRPYWTLLAECSGFYGALHNTGADDDMAAADLRIGMTLLGQAVSRLQADRSLSRDAALALVVPRIDAARTLGENHIIEASAGRAMSPTPEQMMRSTCGSLRAAYSEAVPR